MLYGASLASNFQLVYRNMLCHGKPGLYFFIRLLALDHPREEGSRHIKIPWKRAELTHKSQAFLAAEFTVSDLWGSD